MPTFNEEILFLLRRLHVMSRRGAPQPDGPGGEEKREHGRGRLMAVLADRGEMSQCALASCLDIRPQSLSELVAKAADEGLVNRRQSEDDRRQTLVSLTEEGRARVSAFREAYRRRADTMLAPLTEEEKRTLAAILQKLLDGEPSGENNTTEGGQD